MLIHACTIVTRSSTALLSRISHLSKEYNEHSLLFTLSSNVSAHELSKLVSRLTTFSAQTIGCLSAPFPWSTHQNFIACSIAVFDPYQSTLFRSVIPGRALPQVGRWHTFRNKDEASSHNSEFLDEPHDWTQLWHNIPRSVPLPPGLQHLNPNEVGEVVYLTDQSHEGLSNSLFTFNHATRLGLVAASTPFVTGRPVTLFHNNNIYEHGAVGIAIMRKNMSRTRTEFLGVTPLSHHMTITRCEGNVINSLDGSNPTHLLLTAIKNSGIFMDASGSFKDRALLLGVVRKGILSQIYNITAGDPVRGNISLDSQIAPSPGTQVQFYYQPKSDIFEMPKRSTIPSIKSVGFLTSPEALPVASYSNDNGVLDVDEVIEMPNSFIAASENGFIMGKSGNELNELEALWTCTVPGGLATLEFL